MVHVFGYALAVVGIVFIVMAGSMIARSVMVRRRQSTWQPVQGKVESVDLRTTMNGMNTMNNGAMATGSRAYMIVEYSYRSIDGSEHRGRGRVQNLRIAMGGGEQTVDLLVDPADPSRSMISGASGPIVLLAVVATLFIAVGLGVAVFGIYLATLSTSSDSGSVPCDPTAFNVSC
jgi:hypothetical protein